MRDEDLEAVIRSRILHEPQVHAAYQFGREDQARDERRRGGDPEPEPPPRVGWFERLAAWREFRKPPILCYAYGGTMTTTGRVRVCTKRRGHLDSHAYEFEDVVQARYAPQVARR
jgi:hypothetical protein